MTADARRSAFDPNGLAARVAPFALIGVAALILALPEVDTEDQVWLLTAAVLAAATIGFGMGLPFQRLPAWMEILPPVLFVVAVASLRHAAGGATSGFEPLYLVPVLWLALYGTRAQLLAVLALALLAVAVPIVLVGGEAYPVTEWRRLLVLGGVGGTLGLIVQGLVAEVREAAGRALAAQATSDAQRAVTDAIVRTASDSVVSFDHTGRIMGVNDEAILLFGVPDLVGRGIFQTLVPPDERARLQAGFGRLTSGGLVNDRDSRFEAELLRADGTRVPLEISIARTGPPDAPSLHAFVRDATVRRQAEQAAREHLDDLGRLLAVARDLGRSGVDGPSAICAAARDLSGADFAMLYTPAADGLHLVAAGASGRSDDLDGIALEIGRSITGAVLLGREATFVSDLSGDPRADPDVSRRVGAAAGYFQPILVDGRAVGVLVVYWREPVAELPQRVVTLFGLFAAQAASAVERADLLARLEALARTDALTGAANRRTMDEALELAMAEARRSGRPMSVAMLDLDYFKAYNDERGHQAGDDLLRAAAEAWRAVLRPGDTLARYGGEEFLVVLPACDPAVAVAVAERLRGALRDSGVTASAGTATWDGLEGAETLVERADAALYAAKAAGRDRTVAGAVASSGP